MNIVDPTCNYFVLRKTSQVTNNSPSRVERKNDTNPNTAFATPNYAGGKRLDNNHNLYQYHSAFTNTSHNLSTLLSSRLHLQSNFEILASKSKCSEYGSKRKHTNVNVIDKHIREKGQSTTIVEIIKRPPTILNNTTMIHDKKSSDFDLSMLISNLYSVQTHHFRSHFDKESEQDVVREDMTDKVIKENDGKHKKIYPSCFNSDNDMKKQEIQKIQRKSESTRKEKSLIKNKVNNNTFYRDSRSYTIKISKPKTFISKRDCTVSKTIVYPKIFDSKPALYYSFDTDTSSSASNDLATRVNKSKDKAKLKNVEVLYFNAGVRDFLI